MKGSFLIMIFGYIRVSTNKQDVDNQKFEITKYAESHGFVVDEWIEETISGTKDPNKRKLGKILQEVGSGDIIICAEISRLGRSLFMVMDILNLCMTKEVNVWTIKENYKLGTDISSAILAFAFSLSAQIERDLISARTKEALAKKKAEGVKLGHPKGAFSKITKLTGCENTIQILLDRGNSYAAIARSLDVDRSTLSRFCKSRDIKPSISCNKELSA